MTIAVRLSTGTTLVPIQLGCGESVAESATVHLGQRFVVLEPGEATFTVTGPEKTVTTRTLRHYERVLAAIDLPETADENQMHELRRQWENVDPFYRRVEDTSTETVAGCRVIELSDCRIVEVNADLAPASAEHWTPDTEFLGIPAPLSALVPGTLTGVPDLVAARLDLPGSRIRVSTPVYGKAETMVTVEFSVPFSDARTRLVKENPLNNRRNAKRVRIADTKCVALSQSVPLAVRAPTLAEAHSRVAEIAGAIVERVAEPVVVCATCDGSGLRLSDGVRERKL